MPKINTLAVGAIDDPTAVAAYAFESRSRHGATLVVDAGPNEGALRSWALWTLGYWN